MNPNAPRTLVLMALAVALTAAGAWIRIPLGPIPVTLQTFFVLLSGAVLGPWAGAGAMASYLAMGLLGLPVFASGGGLHYLALPTFGFLLAFPPAAWTVGMLFPRRLLTPEVPGFFRSLAALLAGTAVLYAVGVSWLGWNLAVVQGKAVSLRALLLMGMVPFLPLDLLKALVGAAVLRALRRLTPSP